MEAATSTTQSENTANRTLSTEPAEWTIEDVIHYIALTDPALGQHADLFRKHVIFILFSFFFLLEIKNIKEENIGSD